jgi:hypothetical protein
MEIPEIIKNIQLYGKTASNWRHTIRITPWKTSFQGKTHLINQKEKK